jgi:hypothetical protein
LIRTCHETLRGSAEGEALLAEIVANDKRPDDAWVRKETKRTEEKKRKEGMGIATVSIRNSLVCQDKLRSLQCHNIVERQLSDFLRQLTLFVGQGFDINLELDNVRKAQIALYDRAANQLTRGTWTGAEVAGHGLTGVGSGASTITSSECVSDKCHEPRRSDLMHRERDFLLSVWK